MTRFPVCVKGEGPDRCDHMIVGEAPGRKEIEERVPFVGPSGKRLDKELAQHGWSRGSIYITNAFKGDVGDDNRDPTEEELEDHRELLISEILQVEPRVIMTLGRVSRPEPCCPNCFPVESHHLSVRWSVSYSTLQLRTCP